MKNFLFALVALFSLCATSITVAAEASVKPAAKPMAKHRVVFQISDNDPAKWNLALNNARNVQQDLGASSVQIEIVAYGPGMGMLRLESPVANRVAEAMGAGVEIVACENTMTNQKLVKEDMLSKIGYVKSGVVELMLKQQQGWAYIRP